MLAIITESEAQRMDMLIILVYMHQQMVND